MSKIDKIVTTTKILNMFNEMNSCLMIMTPDGTFKDVVDSRMLECGYMNRYVLDEGDYRLKEINDKAIKAFYDYVKAVY